MRSGSTCCAGTSSRHIQITWHANGNFLCKFVDFGLPRFFEAPSKQTERPDGTVMGSVYCMAPEQAERLPLDGRTYLYSLGCVFHYLLSMRRPLEGETVQQVIYAHLDGTYQPLRSFRPQLSPVLSRWVEWLMSRHPAQRPVDAAEARSPPSKRSATASPWCCRMLCCPANPACRSGSRHLKALLPAKAQPWTPLAKGR